MTQDKQFSIILQRWTDPGGILCISIMSSKLPHTRNILSILFTSMWCFYLAQVILKPAHNIVKDYGGKTSYRSNIAQSLYSCLYWYRWIASTLMNHHVNEFLSLIVVNKEFTLNQIQPDIVCTPAVLFRMVWLQGFVWWNSWPLCYPNCGQIQSTILKTHQYYHWSQR